MVASAVRDSSTGFDLVYYGTSSNGTSKVRDTSTVLLNANAYTATATAITQPKSRAANQLPRDMETQSVSQSTFSPVCLNHQVELRRQFMTLPFL